MTSKANPSEHKSPQATAFKPLTDETYDHLFKVVVIGESGVGKSSLVNQFCFNSFR